MKMKRFVLLTIFCLAASIVAGAQEKISREEYSRQFLAAHGKTSAAASHRQIFKEEHYKDGKLSRTIEITDEFVQPDRRRYVYVGKFGNDETMKFELIQIGNTYYCREDGKWRKSENWCANGSNPAAISNIVSSETTVEEAKLDDRSVRLYRQYTIYKNTFTPGKEILSYRKENFRVSGEGLLLRHEIESGTVNPAKIDRKFVETYEYDANIKIEAPVVAAKKKSAK